MQHSDDLEHQNKTDNKEEIKNEARGETGEQTASQPQWFRVSYQSEGEELSPPPIAIPLDSPAPRARRGRKAALMAAFLALCVIFSAIAGFGGAMIANYLVDVAIAKSKDEATKAAYYRNWVDDGYDYGSAMSTITAGKNNGTALGGSKFGSAGDTPLSAIEVVSAVADSVVEITATVISAGQAAEMAGSGVIIHEDGLVITNNHVVEGASFVHVYTTNGDTYEASVRGRDPYNDIAILKITPPSYKKLTVAKLGCSAALAVGEQVLAIGNPLGQLGGTVTEGIISALERPVTVEGVSMKLLQTSAAINSGNSGGGLFNMAGELIGVVNAKYKASGVEGLGFAIPVDTAIASVQYLLTGK